MVKGQIDEVVMSCLRRVAPGWCWRQKGSGVAIGVWTQGYFNCLFDSTDLTPVSEMFSVESCEEFTVIS